MNNVKLGLKIFLFLLFLLLFLYIYIIIKFVKKYKTLNNYGFFIMNNFNY